MSYSIGQLAALARVTVRTLHHYDEIGLLLPSGRTAAGYRLYAERDLERLQQILFYRELGFPLEDIVDILAANGDAVAHLRRQRQMLADRITRLQAMITAVDKALEAEAMGIRLTPEDRFEVFGDFVPEDHAQEAQDRWGGTDAFRESQRRVSSYRKEDWLALKHEAADIGQRLAAAMQAGTPPAAPAAMDLAEAHRRHISRWFYECTPEIHKGLGEMYVADPRFTAHYEAVAPGLARYIRDAIAANVARLSTAGATGPLGSGGGEAEVVKPRT